MIRETTALNAILIVLHSDLHLPTLTQRALYVSPYREKARLGVAMPIDRLLKVLKGFDPDIIDSRRVIVQRLFEAENAFALDEALTDVLELQRPIAILIDLRTHKRLREILSSSTHGNELYLDEKNSVWYIDKNSTVHSGAD